MKAHARGAGVEPCDPSPMRLERAEIVISAITAANTHAAAKEAAESIRPGTFFLDVNSASPGVKKECAKLIDGGDRLGRELSFGPIPSVCPDRSSFPVNPPRIH